MNSALVVIFLLWLFTSFFCIKEYSFSKKALSPNDHKLTCYTLLILCIGILVRSIFPNYPEGVFLDEAMGGYDAWCLANFGVDQHLASFPVYFKSWGTGMSVLNAYLAIPFIKLFGISILTIRIPMILIGCGSLIIAYYGLHKANTPKLLTFSIITALAINPWHIMKTRWSIDCNIAPDFVLIGVFLLLLAYYSKTKIKQVALFIGGFITITLSAYSYAVAWLMLPFFCISLLVIFYKKDKLSFSQIAIILVLVLLTVLPLLLFLINLFTEGPQYEIGAITIPQLSGTRIGETTNITSGFLSRFEYYVRKSAKLLLLGKDILPWNSIPNWGQYYNPIGIVFIAIGILQTVRSRNRSILDIIFFAWIISSISILLTIDPNTNHWNMLWFPLIYFMGKGIFVLLSKNLIIKSFTLSLVTFLFIGFCYRYATYFSKDKNIGFNEGVEEVIKLAEQKDFEKVYYHHTSHAFYLFYAHPNPYDHPGERRTIQTENGKIDAFIVKNSLFVYRQQADSLFPEQKTAYIIYNRNLDEFRIDYSKFNIKQNHFYTLLWND